MSRLQATTPPVESGARAELVRRVTESRAFGKSPRLREFLIDVCERTLAGHPEEVTEQLIGVRVFGRSNGYNPADDNIVRVSARHLRTKLAEYFAAEGREEPLAIEIPKGSYVPVFVPHALPEPAIPPVVPNPRPWGWIAAAALALVCAGLTWRLTAIPAPQTVAGEVFAGAPVTLVLTDSSLVHLNRFRGGAPSLAEYVARDFKVAEAATPLERATHQGLLGRQITSLADISLLQRLHLMEPSLGRKLSVRHPRHMQVRDFKNGHFILMAASTSNPWVELFEGSLNFHFAPGGIANRAPRAGESALYSPQGNADGPHSGPVRIAMLPNLSGTGRVLSLAGLSMEGTEAAVEFVTDPGRLESVHQLLGTQDLSKLASFEILIEAASMQGAPRAVRVLASRQRP
ncbi:MAG: hypothetical protein SFV18_05780 [Bryobacteraceae bacterium]|nr:hypothetical protein [Bryobacteraceae bacterium]